MRMPPRYFTNYLVARRWPMAEASGTALVNEIAPAECECASVAWIEGWVIDIVPVGFWTFREKTGL
jgi:hypothetical protein